MKINEIEINVLVFAYDGCHKIYLIEDENDKNEAIKNGYLVLPIEKLEETFRNSCPLKFISNWKLTKHFVAQFKKAKFEY